MLVKSIIAGLAGTALLATVAVAQTPTDKGDKMSPAATSPAPAASTSATSPTEFKGNWRASKVAGLSVYNDKNESVGSINDLLMDKSGTIKAVVIGVGGFLGVGEHLVAVPLDKVKFVSEPIAYTGASNGTGGTAKTNTTTGAAPAAAAAKPNPWYPDHAVFNASKDELKAMPEFKYSTD